MAYGLPVSFTMLFVAIPILWFTYKPDSLNISIALEEKQALSTKARRTIKVAAVTLFLWLFGPLITTAFGLPAVLSTSASVAMLAVVLLMLSNCLNWKNLEHGVQWGVLLLLGGGLSLGRGLTESGAAEWLAQIFSANAGNLSMLVLLLLIVSIGVFTTELISNTAITAKLAPIIMGIALQLGLDAENLVVSMAIASSMAFMLPVATPPNAMVHASGQVLQKDMIKVGIRLNIAAVFVITLLFYFEIAG
jgi:sodium-dependent dicarboxylate transporter 2/3/5